MLIVFAALEGQVGVAVANEEVEEGRRDDFNEQLGKAGCCADSDKAMPLKLRVLSRHYEVR